MLHSFFYEIIYLFYTKTINQPNNKQWLKNMLKTASFWQL